MEKANVKVYTINGIRIIEDEQDIKRLMSNLTADQIYYHEFLGYVDVQGTPIITAPIPYSPNMESVLKKRGGIR